MPWLPASTTRKEVCPLMTSCKLSVVFTLWKVWTTILLCDGYCSLCHLPWARKQPTFRDVTTGLLMKWRLRNERRKSILMTRHYLGGVSDWLKQIVSQSEALLGSDVIIMEFLHLFLGRHFLGKPVVASLNVGCFLRLGVWWVALISCLDALLTICWFYLY